VTETVETETAQTESARPKSRVPGDSRSNTRGFHQWRTQEILMGGFHSVVYHGHLYLVPAICDVTF